MIISQIIYYLRNPKDLQFAMAIKHPSFFADRKFLQIVYRHQMGTDLNLKNPQTFNEKLQWLKLYDRKPEYTTMVDKYEVKKYVAGIIGEEYIIPTLGVYNSVKEINLTTLPEQFVLKCTHDSGSVVICRDKKTFNEIEAFAKLEEGLKKNYFWQNREFPYKDVKPRIIAEAYLEDKQTQELRDYKFFCFDGMVKALFVAEDRLANEETKFDFFDANFNHLDIRNGHPNATIPPSKPQSFEKMKEIAEKLSNGIPHIRVDLYEANGKIYFGEVTFYHWSGFMPFEPEEWDFKFGEWLKLPDGGGRKFS